MWASPVRDIGAIVISGRAQVSTANGLLEVLASGHAFFIAACVFLLLRLCQPDGREVSGRFSHQGRPHRSGYRAAAWSLSAKLDDSADLRGGHQRPGVQLVDRVTILGGEQRNVVSVGMAGEGDEGTVASTQDDLANLFGKLVDPMMHKQQGRAIAGCLQHVREPVALWVVDGAAGPPTTLLLAV